MRRNIICFTIGWLLAASPAVAGTTDCSLASPGLSTSVQVTPNVPFTVTVGAKSAPTTATSGVWELMRSQDGTNFAPVAPPPAVAQLGPVTFASPITFDVLEQRANVYYALVLVRNIAGGTIPCRLDQ